VSRPKSTREKCQKCGQRSRSKCGICPACRGPKPDRKRPEGPCRGCGKVTTAKAGLCIECAPTYMKRGPVTWRHGLAAEVPGRWVPNGRGIQVWVPAHPRKDKAA
jgi:hypothetical protein